MSGIKGYISLSLDTIGPAVVPAVVRVHIQIQDPCWYVNRGMLWQLFGVALWGQALAVS